VLLCTLDWKMGDHSIETLELQSRQDDEAYHACRLQLEQSYLYLDDGITLIALSVSVEATKALNECFCVCMHSTAMTMMSVTR
jgi:hypothetical protein